MYHANKIFPSIKSLVLQVVPDAQVYLFGSRANGNATEESDWDILIITRAEVNRRLKDVLHHNLFPFSIEIASFINYVLVKEDQWFNNPSWYSLRKNLSEQILIARA
jgi:predicted nucleotidyltransferase